MTHTYTSRVEPPHADVDLLGDYLDGALSRDERGAIDDHLACCAACRARLGALRLLVERAAHAPASIEPEDDLWPEIRGAIESRRTLSLPTGAPARWGVSRRSLVATALAASVVVAVASSATTALLLRRGAPPAATPVADHAATDGDALRHYAALERDYDRSARQLWAALEAERGTLSPATVATVERSAAAIDRAIAEARAALERDPGNGLLVEMLAASHERKLDLLRRATQLSAGT